MFELGEREIKNFFLFLLTIIIIVFIVFLSKVSYSQGLNKDTLDCLSCHDGVIAKDIALENSHPVGMTYPPLRKTNEYNVFIRLPLYENNTIQCKTCHGVGLESQHWTEMRIALYRSELCLECHSI